MIYQGKDCRILYLTAADEASLQALIDKNTQGCNVLDIHYTGPIGDNGSGAKVIVEKKLTRQQLNEG